MEKIRNHTGATVYVAKITTRYPKSKDEQGKKTANEEEFKAEKQSFKLYEFPTLCTQNNCDENCKKFHENLEEFDTDDQVALTELPANLTGHIVVLFEPAGTIGSNDRIYEQFNYVADKIVYDVKELNGGRLPTINLVAHSRGGITAMQYTLDHPFLVDSLITIGTPFSGSNFGESELILNFVGMSADRNNELFTYGVEDIMNESLQEQYRQRWNEGYAQKYSHINFCAISGSTTLGGIAHIFTNDRSANSPWSNIAGIIIGNSYLGLEILETNIKLRLGLVDAKDYEIKVYDDLFVDSLSQSATGYQGVQTFYRVFSENNGVIATQNSSSISSSSAVLSSSRSAVTRKF